MIPAADTSAVIGPKSASTRSTNCLTANLFATSTRRASTRPPRSAASFTTRSAASSLVWKQNATS